MRFLLCGINAKYIHSNLAIFSLKAYADRKKIPGAEIILKEYTINNYVEDILQDLYEAKADIIIFSCYIWNISFIKELIRKFEVKDKDLSILVVGLGNREVTPDSLGPCVADHLSVTRHIVKEYGKYAIGVDDAPMISAVVPGVMGQTGMESAEIVRGIVSETNPDVIIAVDALAARNSKRLNRTIQIADTGIHPGSGVGNHRNGMTMETLGVPVIGIGVPTVVDAATIVNDTMENFIRALESSDSLKGVGEVLRSYNAGEKYEFVKELISPHLNGMFVTPKDVDEMVHHISHTLSEAINMLFSAGSGRSEA